jgi:hypothetical protein
MVKLACLLCGAPDAISLSGPILEVTCAVCGARQVRQSYTRVLAAARTPMANGYIAPDANERSAWANARTWIAFAVIASVGIGGSLAIGIVRGSALANVLVELTGAFVAAYGLHAIEHPESVRVVSNQGTDAFGKPLYGHASRLTATQGKRIGRLCAAIGFAVVVIGLFIGRMI